MRLLSSCLPRRIKAKANQNKANTARFIKKNTYRKCLRKSKRALRLRYSLKDIIACIYSQYTGIYFQGNTYVNYKAQQKRQGLQTMQYCRLNLLLIINNKYNLPYKDVYNKNSLDREVLLRLLLRVTLLDNSVCGIKNKYKKCERVYCNSNQSGHDQNKCKVIIGGKVSWCNRERGGRIQIALFCRFFLYIELDPYISSLLQLNVVAVGGLATWDQKP